jgi:predicted transcriptional regulator
MKTTPETRLPVQVTTRVEAELAEDLYRIAKAERRSLANLLVLALERYVDEYKHIAKSEG